MAPPAPPTAGTAAGSTPALPVDHLPVPVSGPAPVPVEPPVPTVAPAVAVPSPGPALDLPSLSASFSHALTPGDGEYSVSVSMHPPELGEVRALLSLRGDILQVVLTPHQELGHATLATALPALRDHLASGGLQVDVSLGHPGSDAGPDQGPTSGSAGRAGPGHDGPSRVREPDVTPVATTSDTRIHVVL